MRIAQIAPVWLEVPPQTYGGTEYVVSLLTEELVKRGHDVTLFATADSKTAARLIPIWPRGLFRVRNPQAIAVFGILAKEVLDRQDQFDIIHDHCESYMAPFSMLFRPPMVTTFHSVLTSEQTILFKKFPKINCVAVSKSQKRSGPGLHIVKTIYHGIPAERYIFNPKPQDYLLWISNIAPDKGLADAIQIAKMAREKLVIAGPIFPTNADYFEHRIKPLIDGKQIQYVGTADFTKKVELFKNAKAFVFPIFKREEPFGLVVVESMACGTPVIAPPTGSMPELIEHGKNGFLSENIEDAINAVKKIKTLSRAYCREYIQRNFTVKKMVDGYERLYKKILEEKTARLKTESASVA